MSDIVAVEKVAVVVLAAGGATRFASPDSGESGDNLTSWLGKESVLSRSTSAAVEAGFPVNLIITNPQRDYAEVDTALTRTPNRNWAEGLATSLWKAVAVLHQTDVDVLVFTAGNQPLITSQVFRRLVATHRNTGAGLVTATYEGRSGTPILVARELWSEVTGLVGDFGLDALVTIGETQLVECGDIASDAAVVTAADLRSVGDTVAYTP